MRSLVLTAVAGSGALAGPALDDDKATAPAAGAAAVDDDATMVKEKPVEYGVGLRLRGIFIPKGEIELFVERAGDRGSKTLGYGIDITRRRGNVELQLGVEFEGINPGEGVWIESGKNVANGDAADVILDRSDQPKPLGWVTFEFTFLNHAPINKYLAVRYGGGAGLGIVKGDLRHYDVICNGATNQNVKPGCEPNVPPFNGTASFDPEFTPAGGTQTPRAYDLPPVFPVVNAIIGLQIKPMDKMTINIEGGIRTFLFFGTSASYFF